MIARDIVAATIISSGSRDQNKKDLQTALLSCQLASLDLPRAAALHRCFNIFRFDPVSDN